MANGNRYASVGMPSPSPMGPPSAGPPAAPPPGGAPPVGPPAAGPQNPALAQAIQLLQGHQGPIAELLADPTMRAHLRVVLQAVKQDSAAIQGLAKIGIDPNKIQQFEQMLNQADQGGGGPS